MTKKSLGAHEPLARAAAVEYAESAKVGAFLEAVDEGDHSVTYLFASSIKGYQGWRWSVTLFEQDSSNPTVSEVVLLPGEESILAPAWVPWSERLADWKALQVELEAQAALEAAEAAEAEGESDEDEAEAEGSDNWEESDESDDNEPSEDSESADSEDSSDADAADEVDADEELAATNLEEGENTEGETKDAGKRPPRFARRNRRWGQKKNRKGDSPAE
ncbi:MAG: hypothetical protein RL719_390 [Actinomycetota bacterium]